jgi:hypothetical protein
VPQRDSASQELERSAWSVSGVISIEAKKENMVMPRRRTSSKFELVAGRGGSAVSVRREGTEPADINYDVGRVVVDLEWR